MGHCQHVSSLCCTSLTQGEFGCQVDVRLSSLCCTIVAEGVRRVCE